MPPCLLLCGDPRDVGDVRERRGLASAIAERIGDVRLIQVTHPWDLLPIVREVEPSMVLLLRGAITEHDRRVAAVTSLRRDGFAGPILYAGTFLTERQDAIGAGADYVFDPDRQAAERVIEAALLRPVVAADHPYLQHLCVGEWATAVRYADELPSEAPAVLFAATSCHKDRAFWSRLAEYARSNPHVRCLVVEDDDDEEVHAEAMSCGVQPYVPLAREGLVPLHGLARRLLREAWFERVSKA